MVKYLEYPNATNTNLIHIKIWNKPEKTRISKNELRKTPKNQANFLNRGFCPLKGTIKKSTLTAISTRSSLLIVQNNKSNSQGSPVKKTHKVNISENGATFCIRPFFVHFSSNSKILLRTLRRMSEVCTVKISSQELIQNSPNLCQSGKFRNCY